MRFVSMSLFLLGATMMALSVGCGGGSSGPIVGDAQLGKAMYNETTLGTKSAAGCVSCHNYDEKAGDEKKAPFTKGTATKAASRVAGMSAEEYIRKSILDPDAYVVENYRKGDMYTKWKDDLSEQEIADLVTYLLTEK